jgi:hypothetical protein
MPVVSVCMRGPRQVRLKPDTTYSNGETRAVSRYYSE